MEMVIKISEENREKIKHAKQGIFIDLYGIMETAINNGVPLPKGHGRLIDADAFIDNYEECGWIDDIKVNEFNAITPTIIEADKESE